VRLLLDTCTFLWSIAGGAEVSEAARLELASPENDVFLSAVSAWEIAMKHALGRLPLPEAPARYVPAQRAMRGIAELPLDEAAALQLAQLPDLHRDPFDRMLVCQALSGGLVIVTPDAAIQRYPVRTLW
jgi:PIN domain nuclease of toxin-antitoxin system